MIKRLANQALIGLLAAGALLFCITTPAAALDDPVVMAARAAGQVGEQADGYLGFVPGAAISADVHARVDQINIERRAYFTQLAAQNNASVTEMASAIACRVLRDRVAVGEHYRGDAGAWHARAAGQPVALPSYCANQ
jgi:uncharacterized protein